MKEKIVRSKKFAKVDLWALAVRMDKKAVFIPTVVACVTKGMKEIIVKLL